MDLLWSSSSRRSTLITIVAFFSDNQYISLLKPKMVPLWPQKFPNFSIPSPYPPKLGAPSMDCAPGRASCVSGVNKLPA